MRCKAPRRPLPWWSSRSSSPPSASSWLWASGSTASTGGSGSSSNSAPLSPLRVDSESTGLRETVMNGDRLRSGVPRLRRGRPAWAVPVLLFLAVLLAAALAFNLANLEAGGEAVPALPTGTSPGSLLPLDPVYVDVLMVGAAGPGGVADWPASGGAPIGMFLIVAVLLTIVAVTYLLRRNADLFDRAQESVRPRADRKQAAEAVQATIAELEIGADVRTAILACFQRFCRLLGARGITEQEAFTPRELERVAVDRLRVSADASETLTSLFEEARYSEHALREADRARAIDSLAGIRAALEA